MSQTEPPRRWDTRRCYVDEAGDPALFNKHGVSIIGAPGCSSHFIMGFVELHDEGAVEAAISQLRSDILRDPKLSTIHSVRPESRKTAEAFHARADHPLVRSRVFDLISRLAVSFYAVVRDKEAVLSDVRAANRLFPGYRYSENGLYDSMVSRLFQNRLHVDDTKIVFARRGTRDRSAALRTAIEDAKNRFSDQWGQAIEREQMIAAAYPRQSAGLQVADYCLWALQRLIVLRDETFWKRVEARCVEVVSVDHGEHRTERVFNSLSPVRSSEWERRGYR